MSPLTKAYNEVRNYTLKLCDPLFVDDYNIQPREEVSPPKWHLAHTTWFFESFILNAYVKNYKVFDPDFDYIFNSYYKGHGEHWQQSKRAHLSRPTVDEIYKYRSYVDQHITEFLETQKIISSDLEHLFTVGLNHEQQHQELLLMDIKAILGGQPLKPHYVESDYVSTSFCSPIKWVEYNVNEVVSIGASQEEFSYDNENPQFPYYLQSFSISDRYITNLEYKDFIQDGGYNNSKLWLSQGWDWVHENHIYHPLYWSDDLQSEYTLYGKMKIEPYAPVTHINYYEADAYARWSGQRLPTEFEMEFHLKSTMQSYDEIGFHCMNAYQSGLWCWTSSHYSPYPGFKEFGGKLSEYNGKFMCNQFVLKGGSFATPKNHSRPSYRNFFLPEQQWMFSGIRLAKGNV